MQTIAIIFWIAACIVCYTYIGYGIVLWLAVRVREHRHPRTEQPLPDPLPEVTLFIAAYNEEEIVAGKMRNCRALDYPADRLRIVWVTDGSTDRTNDLLAAYPEVTVHFAPERRGKAAAFNRGMAFVATPLVVFTDANTMLNAEAVREMVRPFGDPRVGCVAGEKRIVQDRAQAAASTEGVYWKYESKLKEWDHRLSTAVGAAGELFAVRRELFEELPPDTLLDDFMLSMRIAARGYKIAYTSEAYAIEESSADMAEEGKRKRRIAAGGLQSIWRLRPLLNPFRYGTMSWQYVSHRVLRWSVTPVLLVALLPLNVALATGSGHRTLYGILLALQIVFYGCAWLGYRMARRKLKNKLLFIPYYFLFMNLNVFRGVPYLVRHRGNGTWEKARRA